MEDGHPAVASLMYGEWRSEDSAVVVLGLLAAAFLGLMALRGATILFAPASQEPFLLPLFAAIPLALAFGMAVSYVTGRILGLYGLHTLRDYESRRRMRRAVVARPDRAAVPESTIEY